MTAYFSQLHLIGPSQGGGPNLRQANVFGAAQSVQPGQYYVPGTGNPAVSTADYYHLDGLYPFRCHDLNTMGAPGQAIAAARGRYFWITSPDHPSSNFGWADGQDFLGGYSDNPRTLPNKLELLFRYNNNIIRGGTENWNLYQFPWLYYNPEDPDGKWFYISAEGNVLSGAFAAPHLQLTQHEQGAARSVTLLGGSWEMFGPTHFNDYFGDWSSFQRVVRVVAGDWYSVGLLAHQGILSGALGQGVWTGTNGRSFTRGAAHVVDTIGDRIFGFGLSDEVTIDAQKWVYVLEDAREADGGMYVTRVAVDGSWNILSSPAPVRISSKYAGVYPGPTYLQWVTAVAEDGVAYINAGHGFPPSSANQGLVNSATYANGGGLWQQNVDQYTEVFDTTAALQAAPSGVQVTCTGGLVSLTWDDALPSDTFRLRRYGTSDTSGAGTLIGDFTGVSATDNPTPGQQYWYKLITMEGATERGSRVVSVYASAHSELTNKHVKRILADGVTAGTYDVDYIEDVVQLLSDCDGENVLSSLMLGPDSEFGVKHTAGATAKIYCLGTTRLPRGGDYTPRDSSKTTYSVTGMNGTVPGWTNTFDGHGYFGGGRFNNIRRKTQITVITAYKKPGTDKLTLVGTGEYSERMTLFHSSGTPGNVSFLLSDNTQELTATVAAPSATGVIVAAGTFDGTNLIAYANGVAGTPVTGLAANADLALNTALKGALSPSNEIKFLGSGSQDSKFLLGSEIYVFPNSEAASSNKCKLVFEKALTATQISLIATFLSGRIGA